VTRLSLRITVLHCFCNTRRGYTAAPAGGRNIITVCLLPRVIYSDSAFPGAPTTYWEAAKRGVAKTESKAVTLKQTNYASKLYTVHSTTNL